MIVNFHISGETCILAKDCKAELKYWPKGEQGLVQKQIGENVDYNPPETKAKRLVYSNKLKDLIPDTLYEFQVFFVDYSTGNLESGPIKMFRTFPSDPSTRSDFTVVFGGDVGNLNSALKMHKTVSKFSPYAAFLGGDLANDCGFAECYCLWDRFLYNWEKYVIREVDGALVPIAPTLGEADLGRNAFSTLSEPNAKNINYFTFLHGYDLNHKLNAYNKMYNLSSYGIEIYGINTGYYGFFQRNEMLEWLDETIKKDRDAFKIMFYHNPIFPACPDHKPDLDELDSHFKLRRLFANLNIKAVFEHNEDLYKITYPLRDKAVVEIEKGTTYFGGGNWGTTSTSCDLSGNETPYYIYKSEKVNNVWLLNIKADPSGEMIKGKPKVEKEIMGINNNGEVMDTFIF